MSNLKYEEVTYDGIKFGTQQYGAMRSLELLGKLAKAVGPVMGALSEMDMNATDLDKYAPLLAYALKDVEPNQLTALVVDVLAGTSATLTDDKGVVKRVDLLGKEALDRVFSGRLIMMFKVVLHALKVNFADFGFGSATQTESAPE